MKIDYHVKYDVRTEEGHLVEPELGKPYLDNECIRGETYTSSTETISADLEFETSQNSNRRKYGREVEKN